MADIEGGGFAVECVAAFWDRATNPYMGRFPSMTPFDFAVNELVKSGGNTTIEKIAGLSCLSLRLCQTQFILLEIPGMSIFCYAMQKNFNLRIKSHIFR
jgi:hypothetical protein